MKTTIYISSFLCLILFLLSGCSGTKNLPAGNKLYTGAEVTIATPKTVNHRIRVKRNLSGLPLPEPNKKLLGLFRTRLWLFQHVKEPKREKGFRNWLKYKMGEAPVYASDNQFRQSTLLMKQYLNQHGYFQSDIRFEKLEKKKTLSVAYQVSTESQYHIRNIHLPTDSTVISEIVRQHEQDMMVKTGEAYDLAKLDAERDKFATFIRSEGFYNFSKEYIFYYVDSAVGGHQLDVYFRIKHDADSSIYIKYYLSDIDVYPFYSIDDDPASTSCDTLFEGGYRIICPRRFIKLKSLNRNILLEKGATFSALEHDYTVHHFLDLGIFKFVNIKYKRASDDSLDVVIQLTPSNTQDVVGEFNINTTTSNFLGFGVTGSYVNRNLLKGGERLVVSGGVNAETVLNSDQAFINTLEITGRVELGFPKLLIPFGAKKVTPYYIPRTRFALGETFQKRIEYYTLNSLTFDFAYDWRTSEKMRHILTPFSINDIRLANATPAFDEILSTNPSLRSSFDDVFIIGVKYSAIYTGAATRENQSFGYLRGNIELDGNLIYLLANAGNSGSKPYELFGQPFANMAVLDFDGRYYVKPRKNHSFVTRLMMGIALPYGNTVTTPYLKQFFLGGATSIRAYRLRTLGPGGYSDPDFDINNSFPDQTGDIKMELNAEYRFGIFKYFKGALFTDLGNVWLLRNDPQRPGGEFDINRFYKEIAIGTGAGIRLDFKFFVIRLDASFPLRKPSLPAGDRWMFDKFEFKSRAWRKDNLIWNVAIGYPF